MSGDAVLRMGGFLSILLHRFRLLLWRKIQRVPREARGDAVLRMDGFLSILLHRFLPSLGAKNTEQFFLNYAMFP